MEVRPGYKRTEVGVVPEDWQIRAIGEIAEVKGGKRLPLGKSLSETDTGHPYIRVVDMYSGGVYLGAIKYVPEDVFPAIKNYTISSADIFISVAGTLGIVGKIPDQIDGANLTENADKITNIQCDQDFLLYNLMSQRIQGTIEAEKTIGAQPKLALGRIRAFRVAIPPTLEEQRAIAEVLSDVDALIAALDRLIAKKRAIKQGAMQQLLTGQTRLPGFRGESEILTLGELEHRGDIRLHRGKVISQKDIDRHPGDYPIYSSSVHSNGLFGHYAHFMFDEELITWSVDGGGHFFHRPKHRFSVTNVCGYLRVCSPSINYQFLAYQLQLLHSRKAFDYTLKAHPSVIRTVYTVALPSIVEQRAIAAILSDMDAEIAALEARRDRTRALKQGMMQELLTGRIRLT